MEQALNRRLSSIIESTSGLGLGKFLQNSCGPITGRPQLLTYPPLSLSVGGGHVWQWVRT